MMEAEVRRYVGNPGPTEKSLETRLGFRINFAIPEGILSPADVDGTAIQVGERLREHYLPEIQRALANAPDHPCVLFLMVTGIAPGQETMEGRLISALQDQVAKLQVPVRLVVDLDTANAFTVLRTG